MAKETLYETFERYRDHDTEQFGQRYRTFNGKDQSDFNAVAHALTSAGLAYRHGSEAGNLAGELREVRSILFDDKNTVEDSLRDNFNNKVGAGIAKYAKDNGLPEEALALLVKDALDRGLLAVSEFKDPRVNWHETLAGRPYSALFDGPSNDTAAIIEERYGLKGLKPGSLSGPGKPIEWLDVSREKATPVHKPEASSDGSSVMPGDLSTGSSASRASPVKSAAETAASRLSTRSQAQIEPGLPDRSDERGGRIADNPFDMNSQDLVMQDALLKRNPVLAERLILAAGRKPRMFGL